VWGDGSVRAMLEEAARERAADASSRTWADVAADVRRIYADVGRRG
jgi:hypothetical protein